MSARRQFIPMVLRIYRLSALLLLNVFFLFLGSFLAIYPFDRSKSLHLRVRCAQWWAQLSCSLLGIHRTVTGSFRGDSTYFIVSNHCSYLDILVIGSLLPSVFISKKEVASWPLFGWLAGLGGTVFIDRESKVASVRSFQEIKDRLSSGISVVVFPEGTTNKGMIIGDFKSTFFKVPIEANTSVLPLSLVYSHINNEPVNSRTISALAWYGDMDLLPHLWNVLGLKRIDVRVNFHPVIHGSAQERKTLATLACETVRSGCITLRRDIQI